MFIEEAIDNHYQDIEKIGEGGFGTVFRAVSRLNGEASSPVTHHD
jgi:serine/threonine protein kinase